MSVPRRVLLAEDDTVDVRAFRRALAGLGVEAPLSVACDGVEAWELLHPADGQPAVPVDDTLCVFDINMPRLTGIELLERIRRDHSLRDLVVFIATTSESEVDRLSACELNVAGYILKSELRAGLEKALQVMDDCARARTPATPREFQPRA